MSFKVSARTLALGATWKPFTLDYMDNAAVIRGGRCQACICRRPVTSDPICNRLTTLGPPWCSTMYLPDDAMQKPNMQTACSQLSRGVIAQATKHCAVNAPPQNHRCRLARGEEDVLICPVCRAAAPASPITIHAMPTQTFPPADAILNHGSQSSSLLLRLASPPASSPPRPPTYACTCVASFRLLDVKLHWPATRPVTTARVALLTLTIQSHQPF
ncbi:uncharacterized protein SETTUDRAFT_37652 [Exserohilum turcica Et28A]|uniref:Uncharacterized protein n=1 Tax=Exserohilum turcicum (strain 28A) TaxID=671987 RepID=R0KMH9_EXST2|nr:uncharacterized protein SETTUDRAFT_37652 [Exserohilum turcica Et28A]EOA89127.1 hypothetical protein SETTUDRAFT_37652 [Exserohilum turcica Et28A]